MDWEYAFYVVGEPPYIELHCAGCEEVILYDDYIRLFELNEVAASHYSEHHYAP